VASPIHRQNHVGYADHNHLGTTNIKS
jgi:hypothetical protein